VLLVGSEGGGKVSGGGDGQSGVGGVLKVGWGVYAITKLVLGLASAAASVRRFREIASASWRQCEPWVTSS